MIFSAHAKLLFCSLQFSLINVPVAIVVCFNSLNASIQAVCTSDLWVSKCSYRYFLPKIQLTVVLSFLNVGERFRNRKVQRSQIQCHMVSKIMNVSLTRWVWSTFGTATWVHGGKFPIQNEPKPTIATIRKLQSTGLIPQIEAVPTPYNAPVMPVIWLALLYVTCILLDSVFILKLQTSS